MGINQIHPFERAGLGHAPFRSAGYAQAIFKPHPDAPARAGTSCDYCGTAIMDVFFVRSADGRKFKVGSDCIRKVFRDFDATIPADFREEFLRVEREKREVKRVAAHERLMARVARVSEILDAHPWLFTSKPHPNAYYASQGKTLRDYYEFMLKNGGATGRTDVCRAVEKEDARAAG